MKRINAVLVIIVLAVVVIALLVLCGPALTSAMEAPSASPSPSAAPTATPPPVVVPASASLVHWARSWRRAAVRQWTQWNRARWCLSMTYVRFGSPQPRRSASAATWMTSGRHWRAMQRDYHARFGILWERMNHPHGNAWERWRPLVRWVWPARLVSTVISIMHYESSGQEFVWCGHVSWAVGEATDAAYGLLQLKPRPHSVYRAFSQIVYAYWHKYVPAGYSFSPWAGCAAF